MFSVWLVLLLWLVGLVWLVDNTRLSSSSPCDYQNTNTNQKEKREKTKQKPCILFVFTLKYTYFVVLCEGKYMCKCQMYSGVCLSVLTFLVNTRETLFRHQSSLCCTINDAFIVVFPPFSHISTLMSEWVGAKVESNFSFFCQKKSPLREILVKPAVVASCSHIVGDCEKSKEKLLFSCFPSTLCLHLLLCLVVYCSSGHTHKTRKTKERVDYSEREVSKVTHP